MSEQYNFAGARRGVFHRKASAGMKVVLVTDEEDKARPATDPNARKPPKGEKTARSSGDQTATKPEPGEAA